MSSLIFAGINRVSITLTLSRQKCCGPAPDQWFASLFLFPFVFCSVLTLSNISCAEPPKPGPLFGPSPLTLETGQRTEAGPFYYAEEKETQRTWAIPPFFSHTQDPGTESEEIDIVYPLITYGGQYRWQIGQLFSFSGGPTQTETARDRFTLFPFYFQQRSSDPSQNYRALIPFYGHLKNRLFRDDVFFIMMPGYVQSRKRDVVTDNFLYPFFHLRHGDALEGWQFWPVVGHEHKGLTTKTNSFGDTEPIGGHNDWFIMWPFFRSHKDGLGTTNRIWQQASLPAYALYRSPLRDSTTVLWPFFSYIDEREKKYHEWQTPWPFVVLARGQGKTTSRFFPLFSQAHSQTLESDSYLWPLYKYNRVHSDPLERTRTRIMFFLYSDTIEKNTETGAARRRVDFWPFFTHFRDFNGDNRLQVLAIVEPFLPNNKSVQRDYSPVYSFWRAEKNPKTGAASQSFLWGLYRRETRAGSKKASLLFGLWQYQADAQGKRARLFYLPARKSKPAPRAQSSNERD